MDTSPASVGVPVHSLRVDDVPASVAVTPSKSAHAGSMPLGSSPQAHVETTVAKGAVGLNHLGVTTATPSMEVASHQTVSASLPHDPVIIGKAAVRTQSVSQAVVPQTSHVTPSVISSPVVVKGLTVSAKDLSQPTAGTVHPVDTSPASVGVPVHSLRVDTHSGSEKVQPSLPLVKDTAIQESVALVMPKVGNVLPSEAVDLDQRDQDHQAQPGSNVNHGSYGYEDPYYAGGDYYHDYWDSRSYSFEPYHYEPAAVDPDPLVVESSVAKVGVPLTQTVVKQSTASTELLPKPFQVRQTELKASVSTQPLSVKEVELSDQINIKPLAIEEGAALEQVALKTLSVKNRDVSYEVVVRPAPRRRELRQILQPDAGQELDLRPSQAEPELDLRPSQAGQELVLQPSQAGQELYLRGPVRRRVLPILPPQVSESDVLPTQRQGDAVVKLPEGDILQVKIPFEEADRENRGFLGNLFKNLGW